MRWKKLGRTYEPRALHSRLETHAANPLPIWISGDVYRVFFSGRDAQNRSSVGAVDVDVSRNQVVNILEHPQFEAGPTGTFYSHGVSIGCVAEMEDERYILFMGWHVPVGGHWYGELGKLKVAPDLSLHLSEPFPFLGLSTEDPISLSYPWTLRERDGSYRMWYGSTVAWDAGNGEMLHVLREASSRDGRTWIRKGTSVPFAVGRAQAFSRPTILPRKDGGFDMWFSYRSGSGQSYRIGRAVSSDGNSWTLELEKSGIDVSSSGWDSEMIEYPFVFEHEGVPFMFYNGNGYGQSGFGLAVLE